MSYPLLDIFWTMLEFFLWIVWIWIFVMVIFDIFRSRDLSGWGKALWVLFVAIIPLIGVLVYLIVRGGSMHEGQSGRRRARTSSSAATSRMPRRRVRLTSWPSWLTCATGE